jgi:hypothetical protein
MIKTYPLEWLDSLILSTLNPGKTFINSITENDVLSISEKVLNETQHIQIQLKNDIFALSKKRHARLLVRKYHSTLLFLLDNVIENQEDERFKNSILSGIINTLISCLDELLAFIENRFSMYLGLDQRVSIRYFIVSRKELKLKLDKLKRKIAGNTVDKAIIEIVLSDLYGFLNSNGSNPTTYRQILYRKELIKQLDVLKVSQKQTCVYTALNELLIYMNFNSIAYINYFSECIAQKISSIEDAGERMDKLLFFFKEFNQLPCNETIILDPDHQNLKIVLSNWFIHEIAYLQKKIDLAIASMADAGISHNLSAESKGNKVECSLSTDQIGLILRASDESRIVKAKSMSEVFKTIVPHLSTPFKKDLSYHSVRSKSYNAEERDKEIAIQTLEKIIKKIRSY